MEVRTSAYGYRVYRGRYLADRPILGIDEDWFLLRGIIRIYNRAEFISALDAYENPDLDEVRRKLRELPGGRIAADSSRDFIEALAAHAPIDSREPESPSGQAAGRVERTKTATDRETTAEFGTS